MQFYEYTQNELNELKKCDKKFAKIIASIGEIKREVKPNLFEGLMSSIVSQQISNKAAATVWQRFCELIGDITPKNVYNAEIEQIQKCGMSMRKAEYIKEAAKSAYLKEIDFDNLPNLPDEEIINQLTKLRGIGVWTVEMLLIFALFRKNVLSYDDLIIRRSICQIFGHDKIPKKEFEKYKNKFSPNGTLASLYLWEFSHKKEASN